MQANTVNRHGHNNYAIIRDNATLPRSLLGKNNSLTHTYAQFNKHATRPVELQIEFVTLSVSVSRLVITISQHLRDDSN